MGINFDRALKLHAQALHLRSRRTEIVAANLANADTPGYMARDFNFKTAMAEALGAEQPLKVTHAHHLQAPGHNPGELLYRMPSQKSLDGNTVETEQEKSVFADNALRYQVSLQFLSGRVKGLMSAIKGE
ncbi:MAG: flagellar basal body rod protein FlgB [Candidatus Competibacteraceae bacterium]|nr:flagellar basal body rod protein FlgB [Candidatus Competibacteraceae bacterium]